MSEEMTRLGKVRVQPISKGIAEFIGGTIGERHYQYGQAVVKINQETHSIDAPLYAHAQLWYYNRDTGQYMVSDRIT